MVVAADLIKKTTIADHFDESITWEANPMLCCLLDADIRSLSYSYDRFVAAQLEIAAEHGVCEITIAHVDFLKRFLAKDRIYRAPMSDTKEENARENINMLIDQITRS
jgi:predicted metal-dependent HD superfamily phosphohydrolase